MTRFYLPSSGAAAVSPAFDAGWEATGSAVRLRCVTAKSSTAQVDKAIAGSGVLNQDTLVVQYVSDPLSGAQTVSGTIQGFLRCLENAAANNIQPSMVVKVVSNDGSTVRGTLFSSFFFGTEFPTTTAASVGYPAAATAVTSVSALNGDRIVIEIGWRQNSTTTATEHVFLGDGAASDYTAAADTVVKNPWIELSASLVFGGGGASLTGSAALTGAGALSATGKRLRRAVASLTGLGALTATARRGRHGAASLTGVGSLAATAKRGRHGTAALAGLGSLSATGSTPKRGVAVLTGTGSLTATAKRKRRASALLSGLGSIVAMGYRGKPPLGRTVIVPRGLIATPLNESEPGDFPIFYPGATAYPGRGDTIAARSVALAGLIATPLNESEAGAFPIFYPGSGAYPGRGDTLSESSVIPKTLNASVI